MEATVAAWFPRCQRLSGKPAKRATGGVAGLNDARDDNDLIMKSLRKGFERELLCKEKLP